MSSKPSLLTADRLRELLEDLGNRLAKEGRTAEIALYGGTALVLLFGLREATRDADYVGISGSTWHLNRLSAEIAKENNLAEDWLNDGVEAFMSNNPDHRHFGDFPRRGRAGLRVFTASPEYLFAMKAIALRDVTATSDFRDAWDLIDICGFKNVDEALNVVEQFYPGKLRQRNALLLEDLFNAKRRGEEFSAALGW